MSIHMLTYNHFPYIRDALHSVLNQKTKFGFEILVHDDASQDGTPGIIQDYARRYPSIIKPIYQTTNQHSQGIYPSIHFNYPRALLPFVAICEGDDYWTDPCKLQIQIEGLLSHPELNLSFHSAVVTNHYNSNEEPRIHGDYSLHDKTVPFFEILHRTRGFIPTASCLFRQSVKVQLLNFMREHRYLTVGDLYMQLFGGMPAGALYFAKPMSAYRFRTEHSWSRRTYLDPRFKAKHEIAMIRSYRKLDTMTHGVHHDDFIALTLTRLLWLFDPLPPPESLPGVRLLKQLHTACQTAIDATLSALVCRPCRYVIYGCASGCKRVLKGFPSDKIIAIIDRDNRRIGESLQGKPIVGTEALRAYSDCDVIVSTIAANRNAIASQATAAGIPVERIHYLFDGALRIVDDTPIPAEITNP